MNFSDMSIVNDVIINVIFKLWYNIDVKAYMYVNLTIRHHIITIKISQ